MVPNNILSRECSRLKVRTCILKAVDKAPIDHQRAFQENIDDLLGTDVFSLRGRMSIGLQLRLQNEIVFFGMLGRLPSTVLLRVEGNVTYIEKDMGLCLVGAIQADPRKYFTKTYHEGDIIHRVDIVGIPPHEVIFAKRTYSAKAITTNPVKMWGPAHDYEIQRFVLGGKV